MDVAPTLRRSAAISLVALEFAFVLHHLWGEFRVYHDGLRLLSVWVSLPIFGLTLGLLHAHTRAPSRAVRWPFLGVIDLVWFGFVGPFRRPLGRLHQ